MSSLSDEEYETFVLILTNGKASLSYNDMSAALVNHEARKKDKEFSSSSTTKEALTTRGVGFNHQKGKGDNNCELGKNQCVFCKDIRKLIV